MYDSDDCKNKLIQHYDFCRSNLENFTAKLSEVTRNFSTNEHDFNTFNELFIAIMNSICKLTKPKTTKRNNVNNPWITDGLIHYIAIKHNLYKNWKRTVSIACPEGNVEKREKYGTYNKHLKKLIKHAKYSFYSKKITNCNGDMKKTWRLINDIRGKHKKDIKPLFNSGNSKITDRKQIANKFNEYYASLAEKMNSSVMHDVSTDKVPPFESYMSKPKENSMYLSDCTDDEIYFIIKDLVDGKSSDIPIKLIKNCTPVITPLLKKYFNNFMQTAEFPDSLKVRKITPVFKKGNQEEFENYRPISTLPIFGKIFEKVIYARLYEYFTTNGLLYENQFGFRKSHSCSHALNHSLSEINKTLHNGKHMIGIYIDLSKAFDTIDHSKLLHELNRCGVRGNVHSLLKSYLNK